jgi:membrane-bound lytic murein transglycosylase B
MFGKDTWWRPRAAARRDATVAEPAPGGGAARARALALCLLLASPLARAVEVPALLRPDMEAFLQGFASRHALPEDELRAVLLQVEIQQGVIRAITTPATSRPWREFRQGLVTRQRIEGGVGFWAEHEALLADARERFGVPEEIVVAIIGVETQYGRNLGSFRVLDALATIAFEIPARAAFFQNELEQFLLLCAQLGLDPLGVRGSFAGAMGMPQFIPSSYRRYAVDFDGDGRVDLWSSPADVIGSVAHYLKAFGWQPDGRIALRASVRQPTRADALVQLGIQPAVSGSELKSNGVVPEQALADDERAALMRYEGARGVEYWLGLQNFYAITRYNRSQNYALAVFQLAQEIAAARSRGGPRRIATVDVDR